MEWVKVTNVNCMRIVEDFEGVEITRFTTEYHENGVLARGDEESLAEFIDENMWLNRLDEAEGRSMYKSDFCCMIFELGNGISVEISNTGNFTPWALHIKYPEGDEVRLDVKWLNFSLIEMLDYVEEELRNKEDGIVN